MLDSEMAGAGHVIRRQRAVVHRPLCSTGHPAVLGSGVRALVVRVAAKRVEVPAVGSASRGSSAS